LSCDESIVGQQFQALGALGHRLAIHILLPCVLDDLRQALEAYGFSFKEWVIDLAQGSIHHRLVRLVSLEDALSKGGVRGVSAIRGLSSQHEHVDRMSLSHGEEGVGRVVVEYELDVLSLRPLSQGVVDGVGDAEVSVGAILDVGRSWVDVGQVVGRDSTIRLIN
jgi:hypothetical protein